MKLLSALAVLPLVAAYPRYLVSDKTDGGVYDDPCSVHRDLHAPAEPNALKLMGSPIDKGDFKAEFELDVSQGLQAGKPYNLRLITRERFALILGNDNGVFTSPDAGCGGKRLVGFADWIEICADEPGDLFLRIVAASGYGRSSTVEHSFNVLPRTGQQPTCAQSVAGEQPTAAPVTPATAPPTDAPSALQIAVTGPILHARLVNIGEPVPGFPLDFTERGGVFYAADKFGKLLKQEKDGKWTTVFDVSKRDNFIADFDLPDAGLALVALHPTNDIVFISYTVKPSARKPATVVLESVFERCTLQGSCVEMFRFDRFEAGHHGPSSMSIGPDGHLYVFNGYSSAFSTDKLPADPDQNAQNLSLLNGKLVRVDVSGTTFKPVIVARGIRHGYDHEWKDGKLYFTDIGDSRFEEFNAYDPTSRDVTNFGWPLAEGTKCHQPGKCNGLTAPLGEFTNSGGKALLGMRYYTGANKDLKGKLLGAVFMSEFLYADLEKKQAGLFDLGPSKLGGGLALNRFKSFGDGFYATNVAFSPDGAARLMQLVICRDGKGQSCAPADTATRRRLMFGGKPDECSCV